MYLNLCVMDFVTTCPGEIQTTPPSCLNQDSEIFGKLNLSPRVPIHLKVNCCKYCKCEHNKIRKKRG